MLAIVIYHKKNDDYLRLASVDDTQNQFNWFIRSQALENILMGTRLICNEVKSDKPIALLWEKYSLLAVHSEDLYCVLVQQGSNTLGPNVACDCMRDYQRLVPNWSLFTIDQDYPLPNDWLQRVNSLDKIKNDVEEVKTIMMKNLEEVTRRYEKLESIDAKAIKLGDDATKFVITAKRKNRCCKLMFVFFLGPMALTLDDLLALAQNENWDGNDQQHQRWQIRDWVKSVLSPPPLAEIVMNYFPLTICCTGYDLHRVLLSRPIQFTETEAQLWHMCNVNWHYCRWVNNDAPLSLIPNVMRLWDYEKNMHVDPTKKTLRSCKKVSWKDGSLHWSSPICKFKGCYGYFIDEQVSKETQIAHFLRKLAYGKLDTTFQCGFFFLYTKRSRELVVFGSLNKKISDSISMKYPAL